MVKRNWNRGNCVTDKEGEIVFTHSSWGITAAVKSSMSALPPLAAVNTRNAGINECRNRKQSKNAGDSYSSHCLRERERLELESGTARRRVKGGTPIYGGRGEREGKVMKQWCIYWSDYAVILEHRNAMFSRLFSIRISYIYFAVEFIPNTWQEGHLRIYMSVFLGE